jgi:transcription termination/antitermination protein NusG
MSDSNFSTQPTTVPADQDEDATVEETKAVAEAMGDRIADTETEEAAELVEQAEGGDEAAEVALQEAGGGGGPEPEEASAVAEPVTEETSEEAIAHLEAESAPEPPRPSEDEAVVLAEEGEPVSVDEPLSEVTDVPTQEATLDESEAERDLASDTVEGEDEGPLVATGPDTYLEPEAPEVTEAPAEAEPAEAAAEEAAAEVAEPAAEVAEPAAGAAGQAVTAPAETEEVEEVAAASTFGGPGDWYVIHTYAGYENKVKTNLSSRIGSMQMEDKIFDVVIPMEDVMEIKGGKKQVVQKKVFPGYLMVKMIYDNDSWYVVRNTPGVTGFVSSGTGTKPTPLSKREVEKILAVKEETKVKPQFRLEWEEGDVVRIVAGPFADFTGTIAEINVEQSKLKVMVNIFDRETPVELAFDQVAKA